MNLADAYNLLGVSPDCSDATLKRALKSNSGNPNFARYIEAYRLINADRASSNKRKGWLTIFTGVPKPEPSTGTDLVRYDENRRAISRSSPNRSVPSTYVKKLQQERASGAIIPFTIFEKEIPPHHSIDGAKAFAKELYGKYFRVYALRFVTIISFLLIAGYFLFPIFASSLDSIGWRNYKASAERDWSLEAYCYPLQKEMSGFVQSNMDRYRAWIDKTHKEYMERFKIMGDTPQETIDVWAIGVNPDIAFVARETENPNGRCWQVKGYEYGTFSKIRNRWWLLFSAFMVTIVGFIGTPVFVSSRKKIIELRQERDAFLQALS